MVRNSNAQFRSTDTLPRLTRSQREAYDRLGYVIVPGVFPTAEVAEINREITRLRETSSPGAHDSPYFLGTLSERSSMTQAICRDERVLALVGELVSPGISIYSAKLVEKPPHDLRPCHWHQDNAYYIQTNDSACRMSIWMPLQDVSEGNGALWVVPGSHREGVLECQNRQASGECGVKSFADADADLEGQLAVPMQAGDVLLFHANLKHRSKANHSDHTRRAFIISYQEGNAASGDGKTFEVIREA